jgi:hypothetical protein
MDKIDKKSERFNEICSLKYMAATNELEIDYF